MTVDIVDFRPLCRGPDRNNFRTMGREIRQAERGSEDGTGSEKGGTPNFLKEIDAPPPSSLVPEKTELRHSSWPRIRTAVP